jgi:hypothetical protein
MNVTAWKSPGTCASVANNGGGAWSNPDNAKVSDDSRASVAPASEAGTAWLRCTNFGFTTDDIPAGAVVAGIEVEIERCCNYDDARYAFDYAIYLRKTSGQVGDNKAKDSSQHWPLVASEAYGAYGGSADDWNANLTSADIRNADFGIDISADGEGAETTGYIDHVRIRIYYIPVTDWHYPADCNHVNGGAGGTWNNPENAEGEGGFDDGNKARFDYLASSPGSWLRCFTFNFLASEIPKGSVIKGIEFEAKLDGEYAVDGSIRLRNSGGQIGDDKADAGTTWDNFAITYKVWGGSADLWNAGMTRAEILASTFGIDISTKDIGSHPETSGYVDGVRLRIHYEPPSTGPFGAVI